METETRGKYMLIFRETDIEKAKESLGELIEAFGRNSKSTCAKIALDKFHEFPELDSLQRVSMSVQSKGLRIGEMLEMASAQRTKSTTRNQNQPKFQFHVNKELQQQLPIATQRSYSNATSQNTEPKNHITITPRKANKPTNSQQIAETQGKMPKQMTQITQQGLNEQGMGTRRMGRKS
jgi:hypothetical protein